MNIKVISISPSHEAEKSQFDQNQEIATYDIVMLMGQEVHQFKLAVDVNQIGDRQISIVKTDKEFDEIFKFYFKLHRDICQLVFSIYNHSPVQFPIELGDLDLEETTLVKC